MTLAEHKAVKTGEITRMISVYVPEDVWNKFVGYKARWEGLHGGMKIGNSAFGLQAIREMLEKEEKQLR